MPGSAKWIVVYVSVISLMLLIAWWGGETVTTIAENAAAEQSICIVIDPGHGGIDGGAISCTGMLESSLNLEVALRLNDLLGFLGYETKMTRTSDISIHTEGDTIARKKLSDLKERVRIVNETPKALLLSIHQNNFSDSKYSGAQVFYSGTAGSEVLAEQMQAAFVSSLNPGSNRKEKECKGIYMMDRIKCTGILLECGFLSNRQEEAKLRDPEYQKKICAVIAATVSTFVSNS